MYVKLMYSMGLGKENKRTRDLEEQALAAGMGDVLILHFPACTQKYILVEMEGATPWIPLGRNIAEARKTIDALAPHLVVEGSETPDEDMEFEMNEVYRLQDLMHISLDEAQSKEAAKLFKSTCLVRGLVGMTRPAEEGLMH